MVEKNEAREIFLKDAATDFEGKWAAHKAEETQQTQEKKLFGLIKKQPQQQEKKQVSGQGKDIIKELPLSKFEWPLLILMSGTAFIMLFLDRLKLVTDIAGTAVIVLLIYSWGMYMIKRFFFMPIGGKSLILRAYKNTGMRLSVEKIPPDRMVHFDKDDITPPVSVERTNKHYEVNTGKPLIIAIEGKANNINLFEEFEEEKEAKEFNNIVKTVYATAWQACLNNMLKFKNKVKDPMFILTVLVLIAVAVSIFIQFTTMTHTLEQLEAIATAVGVTTEVA